MSKTNHVRLIGHLGSNPKLVQTDNSNMVLSVSIATNENYKDKDGQSQKRTDWHNLVAFGKVAQLINDYLKKGSHCMVLGRLQTRQYTDKADIERYTTEIVVEEILFLDNKKE